MDYFMYLGCAYFNYSNKVSKFKVIIQFWFPDYVL